MTLRIKKEMSEIHQVPEACRQSDDPKAAKKNVVAVSDII